MNSSASAALAAAITSSIVAAGPAVGDVVPHRDREQERLVEDEADVGTQALERVLAHVAPVDQQRPPETS